MFQVYSNIIKYTNNFYTEKKFDNTALPLTTSSISSPMGIGSDSLPVKINLLGQKIYLADSMQFFLEYCLRFNNNPVYYIMPSFRGESCDSRHLSQFYHSEVEIIGNLHDIMNLAEEYFQYLAISLLKENCVPHERKSEIKKIIMLDNFPRLNFKDAIKILKNECNDGIEKKEGILNINSMGEKYLIKKFNGILWLTHFEHISVPFYQEYDPKDPNFSLTADLLVGIGETLGCGQRVNGYSIQKSLYEHGVNENDYEWYVQMKKEFPLKTGGFGMGIERFIAWIFGISDIREIPYVYRDKETYYTP
jgi:aspartyl/asparaginyl-tRNA synthetase